MKQKRVLLILVATILVALALTSGCSKNLGKALSNRPPETGIFLEGPLDTVRYAVKLHWWGQDTDGEVIGFYYRWTCADPAAQLDTSWVFTTTRSRDFILPVPNGFAIQSFWVKAVDDKGLEDPSPDTLSFPVRNSMPSVAFVAGVQPDTTLPAATFSWTGTDPEGNNTIAYYVIWLNGRENEPIIVAGQDTTLGPDYISSYGDRTFYVRAVDEARGASPVISHTWHVIAPNGDVLLVDDVPPSLPGDSYIDAFFRGVVDSLIPGGQYTVFDLGNLGRVKSPLEVGLILPLFKKVVWYGDKRSTISGGLQKGEQGGGIATFLNSGGKIFLEGVALVGTGGSLSNSFAAQYLGIDSLRTRYISQFIPHSTNFDFSNPMVLYGSTSLGLDSLQVQGIIPGCELMHPSAQAEPLYYATPDNFPEQTGNCYAGTLVRGGRFSSVCLTFPVARCNGFGNAKQEVAKLLTFLGVGQ
jgi:hypothetical protein